MLIVLPAKPQPASPWRTNGQCKLREKFLQPGPGITASLVVARQAERASILLDAQKGSVVLRIVDVVTGGALQVAGSEEQVMRDRASQSGRLRGGVVESPVCVGEGGVVDQADRVRASQVGPEAVRLSMNVGAY